MYGLCVFQGNGSWGAAETVPNERKMSLPYTLFIFTLWTFNPFRLVVYVCITTNSIVYTNAREWVSNIRLHSKLLRFSLSLFFQLSYDICSICLSMKTVSSILGWIASVQKYSGVATEIVRNFHTFPLSHNEAVIYLFWKLWSIAPKRNLTGESFTSNVNSKKELLITIQPDILQYVTIRQLFHPC